MRSMSITLLSVFLAVAVFPFAAAAQNNFPHYAVKTLSTLGGTYGTAQQMNSSGLISGDANLTGDTTEHATFWTEDGGITDMGTLGGLNSGAGQVNERGLILGVSQTGVVDPLGENWGSALTCSASGGLCEGYQNLLVGFLWQKGLMAPLPTLGGNNANVGFTTPLNNRNEAVGWAETSTQDASCTPPQILDWEAVVWGPGKGEIRELPPLSGDTVGAAFGINEKGQVVGATTICAFPSFSLPTHAVLWQNGKAINLPTLGGIMSNAALSINNRGQIVGVSDLPGDAATHAVLWQRGKITDLGTLPGDYFSFAYGINDEGQVIIQSCDINFNCRAALWQNGSMTDVNTLTPPGSLYLALAQHINNQGEITGQGFDPNTGNTPPYVALPCDENHAGTEGCEASVDSSSSGLYARDERPKIEIPIKLRNVFRRRWGR